MSNEETSITLDEANNLKNKIIKQLKNGKQTRKENTMNNKKNKENNIEEYLKGTRAYEEVTESLEKQVEADASEQEILKKLEGKVAIFSGGRLLMFPILEDNIDLLSYTSMAYIQENKLSIPAGFQMLEEMLTEPEYKAWLKTPLHHAVEALQTGIQQYWIDEDAAVIDFKFKLPEDLEVDPNTLLLEKFIKKS